MLSAPKSSTKEDFSGVVIAITRAPLLLASCTRALPTPPEAPGTNTVSVSITFARVNIPSAVV